jgi:hypothetical protein
VILTQNRLTKNQHSVLNPSRILSSFEIEGENQLKCISQAVEPAKKAPFQAPPDRI